MNIENEVASLRTRIEALEQRLLTIDNRTSSMIRLGPPRDTNPYDLNEVATLMNKRRKRR